MTYVAKIAAAIGYDRLRGDVAVGNAKVGAPASIAGPWSDAGGALGFDGVDDGAILQPRDLPRNFEVPGGFTCTGLHWDAAEGAWWVVDFDAAAVYLVDPNNFTVLRTIAIGGGALLQGVVSNATDLYVADWSSDSIRVFNKTTGVEDVGAAIALGWNPNGVTFNGSGNLLIIRAETLASANLYEYTTAGLLVGSKTIPASGYYSLDGCHWADASTLYVCADRPSGAGNRDQILVVNPATGAITTRYAAPSAIEDVSVKGAEVFVTADDEFHSSAVGGNRVSRIPLATHRDLGVSWFMKAGAVDGSEVIWSLGNPIDASGSDVNVERGIAAYLTTTSGQLRLILCDGTANVLIHNFTGLSFAAWKHYAISIDAATQTMTLYVDGVQHGSAADVSTLNLSSLWWKHRLSAGYTVDGVPSRFCDVDVARVAWFDETISAAEAVELAAGSEPTFTDPGAAALAGDVLHWGGSGGSTAADWDAEGQAITAYSVVVKQDGSPVGSPAQALSGSLDLSAFGSGDYTVEQTATNAAGESVTAVTPAVAYSASVTPPTMSGQSWWELSQTAGLIARWNGDGDDDNVPDAIDIETGVVANWVGTSGYTDGPFTLGAAFSFDAGSHLDVGSVPGAPAGGSPRTLTCWIKTNDAIASQGLFGYAPGANGEALEVFLSGGEFEIDWGGHRLRSSDASISASEWTHVALVTPDGALTTDQALLYVNGSQVATATIAGAPAAIATAAADLRIGANNDGSTPFDGTVWDIRVYRRALTPDEILEESGGPEPLPTTAAEARLIGDVVHWGGSGRTFTTDWDSFGNGPVAIVAAVSQSGTAVLNAIVTDPLDGASQDLSALGAGVFEIELTASNAGGSSSSGVLRTNAIFFPARPPASIRPSPAGLVTAGGAAAGSVNASPIAVV